MVRDAESKKWIQERYLHFTEERFSAPIASLEGIDTPHARMLRTVMHLALHLHEIPVLPGQHQSTVQPGGLPQRCDHGRHLDGFGPGSDHDQDARCGTFGSGQ